MMSLNSVLKLFACVVLCLGVGAVGGFVTASEIPTWYAGLVKPWWTPPSWVFPVVWNILYVMMAVSLWLLWDRPDDRDWAGWAIRLFLLQLVLNAIWSPVFFGMHRPDLAFVIIICLIISLFFAIKAAWRVKRVSAWLLFPYFLWCIYASTLNAGIVFLNPIE